MFTLLLSLPASFAYALANVTLCSYFVTELLGTDLHRLLTSRPLEKQFIQYFLYQIMVCGDMCWHANASIRNSFWKRNGN